MPNMAVIVLSGHLGKDPEARMTSGGTKVASFSLAVKTGYGDKAQSTWYRCTAFGKNAETAEKYLKKGQAVNIVGEPSLREYETSSGVKGQSLEVAVEKICLLGDRPTAATNAKPVANVAPVDDEIPF